MVFSNWVIISGKVHLKLRYSDLLFFYALSSTEWAYSNIFKKREVYSLFSKLRNLQWNKWTKTHKENRWIRFCLNWTFYMKPLLLSPDVTAARCFLLMAPDLNVKIVTTLTSVKTASRHANTTPDIPLAGSMSLVSPTFANIKFCGGSTCVCINLSSTFSTNRPVSGFLWPFRKTAQEAPQQPAWDADWRLVSSHQEPQRVVVG